MGLPNCKSPQSLRTNKKIAINPTAKKIARKTSTPTHCGPALADHNMVWFQKQKLRFLIAGHSARKVAILREKLGSAVGDLELARGKEINT
jgi:hypothetical protein